ncbi:MAG: DNA methyltransferase [Candidatus Diapherotrites archaeon]|uniref:site-specific DNA-methyltransferase (cytosine-N(4)-specific) n=1 Tax=Candidatus Iainarchaeum sp. TaxID=3101447 RepID=A0A8T3YJF7_9ARCH|nr:DNA methyltransferase [Candidatus Diapherotrites archaeon]
MMIPQVARRLMNEFGAEKKTVLDPFMGSGTVLVESCLLDGFERVHGVDINPLALLIAKVKTTPIDTNYLELEFSKLKKEISKKSDANIEVPDFSNIKFWFKPRVIKELAIIKKSINAVDDRSVKDFFKVAFAETVRNVSDTRKGEYKLYKMAPSQLERFEPDVLREFYEKARENICGMKEFIEQKNKCKVFVLDEDTRHRTSIPDRSVDLVVTSPPYGDSKTTVAYGQFSRLALQWLDYNEKKVKKIDQTSLGGIPAEKIDYSLESLTLAQIVDKIAKIDERRAKEVLSFYKDFYSCAKEIDRVMKVGGTLCFVVGNRTVKQVQIPTDKIIVELFKSVGTYEHEKTIIRNIPSKRLPKSNSPTNVKGEVGSTMNHEFIVILKKRAK